MRTNNFQISLMRRDGMSIADISAKTGIEPEEITRRLKAYEGTILASVKMGAVRARKGGHNNEKHPERNSQFAEKGKDK
jgi:hypothetical protein